MAHTSETFDLSQVLRLPPEHPFYCLAKMARDMIFAELERGPTVTDAALRLGMSYRSMARLRAAGLLDPDTAVRAKKPPKRRRTKSL